MPDLIPELREQPDALRRLAQFYENGAGAAQVDRLLAAGAPRLVIFIGMGASYHAALIAAAHAAALGLPALALEAIDLLNYQGPGLLQSGHTLVYISQSGKSVEVESVLTQNQGHAQVIAVTNQPDSLLAQNAQAVLPLLADQRYRLASKNYVNTLAVLWLLVRRWAGLPAPAGDLLAAADQAEAILAHPAEAASVLLAEFGGAQPLVFLGHGPHAATARQSALMLSEWARFAALYSGVGAFRHGFVETVTPQMGVLFFAPPGRTHESALRLARALPEFGVRVRRMAFGQLCGLEDNAAALNLDEFLSPLLDVIPMQLFTEALSRQRDVTPDFRFIDKTRTV